MTDKEKPTKQQMQKNGESRLLGNAYIRAVNQAKIVDLFRTGEQLSRTDIARICNLTKPTVSAIVESLIGEGILKEAGMGPSEGGRRARLIEFNPESSTFVGIHFGEETTHVAVTDALGRMLTRKTAPTVIKNPDESLRAAQTLLKEALKEAGRDTKPITAAGVSVPGLVDRQQGICKFAPNLGWRDYPLASELSKLLGVDVFVANTTQNAALAEHQMGVARGHQNFVWVYVGRGVGSCAVIGGRIQLGTQGYAGEIGHCRIETPGILCGCGKRGCLETTCSNIAIAREAQKAISTGEPSTLALLQKDVSAWDVSMAAANGDPLAQKVMTEAGRSLGQGVSILLNIFDPEMIVIGGPIAGTDEFFLEGVKEQAARFSLDSCNTDIVFSHLGSDIYLMGAVLMAMDQSNAAYRIVKTTRTLDEQSTEQSTEQGTEASKADVSAKWSEL